MNDLIENIRNEIELNAIDKALNSDEVKQAKRIARNINLVTIKSLRKRHKELGECVENTEKLVLTMRKERQKLHKEIVKLQKELTQENK